MYLKIFQNRFKLLYIYLSVFFIMFILSFLHLKIGAVKISMMNIYNAIFNFDINEYIHHIIIYQRATRLLVAFYIGASLAISGFVVQKVFQNPILSPSLLGMGSGATFFSLLFILFMNWNEGMLFIPSLIGSSVAIIMSLSLVQVMGKSSVSRNLHIVFSGSLISILFSSFSTLIISMFPLRFSGIQSWLLGTIGNFDYNALFLLSPIGIIAIIMLFFMSKSLDVLILGDKQAESLGISIKYTRFIVLGLAVCLSALSMSIVGPIGFVGLVVPHMVKIFVDETGKKGMFLCILFGAIILIIADIIARTLFAPKILLVGAVMALIGGSIFIILLFYSNKIMKFNK